MNTFDLAIVGGGLVGASLAVALGAGPRRVVLVEAATPPASAPAWDERCIALNDASRRIFESWDVWAPMGAQAASILATHISEQGRFGAARFAASEAGIDALGYNVPLRAIGAALQARMSTLQGLRLVQPAKVESLKVDDDAAELGLTTGETLKASLVVAADGARSSVRALLGLAAQSQDYGQQAIVSAVRLPRGHGGVAYERFTPGGPIALIPKPDHDASLVWTVANERADALLALSDADYLDAAQQTFGGRLGRFAALGRRWAHPLARVMSRALSSPRVVFVGNAAQSLHPVAAQGFNLGLRDVATLAALLEEEGDPGAPALLAEYCRSREQDRHRVSGITDLMVRTFSNRLPGLSQMRHWGLVAIDLAQPLRNTVLRQHLGYLGLPAGL